VALAVAGKWLGLKMSFLSVAPGAPGAKFAVLSYLL